MPILLSLTGTGDKEERQIPKSELIDMARAYRDKRHKVIKAHGNNKNDARTCYFSKQIYMAIFEKGCDGIRTYYGVRSELVQGKKEDFHNIILVGTRKGKEALGENDYVAIARNPEDGDMVYDWGSLCPPGDDCAKNIFLEEIDCDETQTCQE